MDFLPNEMTDNRNQEEKIRDVEEDEVKEEREREGGNESVKQR